MKILGTGLNGLVGSRIVELLHTLYDFENISRSTGVDITNRDQVMHAVAESDAEVILHLAAKASVDGCEDDKDKGEMGDAWQINVGGSANVADACRESGKKMMYISTDFVFDGEKEFYTEEDTPHAINWYGQTKLEGENVVRERAGRWIILRPAYPYRASCEKNDFMRAMKTRLENNQPIQGVTDHYFAPTFIDDIANALDLLLSHNIEGTVPSETKGIFHIVGSTVLTPYEAAMQIAQTFGFSTERISKTTRAEYFKNKAKRPFRLALKNGKIEQLGAKMRTFEAGLHAIQSQI